MQILIKSWDNSEWDSCSHLLLNITKELLEPIQEIKNKIEEIIIDNKVNVGLHMSFDGEFVNIDEDQFPECFKEDITIPLNIKWEQPEQTIRMGKINVDNWGISFIGWGKHTGEEYYTSEIKLEELWKLL